MRILLAVDYSPDFERAIEEFAKQAWPLGTIVRVLGVVENIPPSAAELWFDAAGSLEAVLQAREEQAQELVLKTAELLRQKGLTAETEVRRGRRRREIAKEAKIWAADLILDGSRRLSSISNQQ